MTAEFIYGHWAVMESLRAGRRSIEQLLVTETVETKGLVAEILAIAAASMIYVAVADLIPGLHKRTQIKDTVQQVSLIVLGIATVGLLGSIVSE